MSHRVDGERLFADVVRYCEFGDHRTASEADLRTVAWLKTRLRDLGYETHRQPFAVRQFFPRKCSVRAGGERLDAFPLWFPATTGSGPLTAPLSCFPSEQFAPGDIAVVAVPRANGGAILGEHEDLALGAADAGASAVIAVSHHPDGEVVALNVSGDPRPWPCPVLVVGSKHASTLAEASAAGHEGELSLAGEWRPAAAKNIIGRREGRGPLLVVSTPISGWFRCGGERGPGVALWLALADWAADEGLPCMVVGTSGHELGGRGMHAVMREQAPHPDDVDCWLHLGASFACWEWRDTDGAPERTAEPDAHRFVMASDDLLDIVSPAFAGHAGLERVSERTVGEMQTVLEHDYRSFGLAGAHRYFHTPADGPEMTGPGLLASIGAAIFTAVESALE
ncbi:MAG: hypothetical protein ACREN5_08290 [Gemmatimonadales bacterium]